MMRHEKDFTKELIRTDLSTGYRKECRIRLIMACYWKW